MTLNVNTFAIIRNKVSVDVIYGDKVLPKGFNKFPLQESQKEISADAEEVDTLSSIALETEQLKSSSSPNSTIPDAVASSRPSEEKPLATDEQTLDNDSSSSPF